MERSEMSQKSAMRLIVLLMVCCQSAEGKLNPDEIDQILQNVFGCHQYSAMVVSIVDGKQIVFSKGYGHANTETKEPATKDSLVAIGTLSMALTSTLLLDMFPLNIKFNLFTKMNEIYKDWKVAESPVLTEELSMRDMMAQKAGLQDFAELIMDKTLTRKNAYKRLMELPVEGEFRYSFVPSRLVYGVLTHIAEKYGQEKFESLMEKYILRPVGMDNTKFLTSSDLPVKQLVKGYTWTEKGVVEFPQELYQTFGELCGADGILSTADDMAKWLLLNLNLGVNMNGAQVIKQIDIEKRMFKPYTNVPSMEFERFYTLKAVPASFVTWGYGYGWKFGEYKGIKILFETSANLGFTSLALMAPDFGFGIFVSVSGTKDIYPELLPLNIFMYFFDLFLGETPWLDASSLCTFPGPWFDVINTGYQFIDKSLPLALPYTFFTGSYRRNGIGTIEVKYNQTSDSMYAMYSGEKWLLYASETKNKFFYEITGFYSIVVDNGEMTFYIDDQTNKTTSVILKTQGMSTEFQAFEPSVAASSRNTLSQLLIILIIPLYCVVLSV